jgi:hypothetical protein
MKSKPVTDKEKLLRLRQFALSGIGYAYPEIAKVILAMTE